MGNDCYESCSCRDRNGAVNSFLQPPQRSGTMPTFTCPGCQTPLSLGEHLQGKKVRCKHCGHVFLAEAKPLGTNEPDEAENENKDAPEHIQQPPRPSKRPAVSAQEGLASPPRRQQKRSDLPPLPVLRRHRWGLIYAL